MVKRLLKKSIGWPRAERGTDLSFRWLSEVSAFPFQKMYQMLITLTATHGLFEKIGKYQIVIRHGSFSGCDDIKGALHFQPPQPYFPESAA